MATCDECKQEMKTADGCTAAVFTDFADGVDRPRIRFGAEGGRVTGGRTPYANEAGRCHDCGAKPGQYHHPGCDVERCPKCRAQAIGCGCCDPDEEG